jgi:hypothetical protein
VSSNTERAQSILEWSKPALQRITELRPEPEAIDRVCWHLSGITEDGDFDRFDEDYQARISARASLDFSDMEFDYGGLGGFEMWETVTPNEAWLDARLPEMTEFADALGVRLDGWSFEPFGRLPSGEIPQAFSSLDDEMMD